MLNLSIAYRIMREITQDVISAFLLFLLCIIFSFWIIKSNSDEYLGFYYNIINNIDINKMNNNKSNNINSRTKSTPE